jgi:glycosyltransferase involved in cell wall biosynthesis
MLPLVSIVTPTYNRRRFIPALIKIVQQQTYPRDRLEWVIYDDGQEPIGDLLEAAKNDLPKLNYIFSEDKMTIGEKRNRLNQEAKGDILVAMDDDDYYFPQRVSAAVSALSKSPSVDLAGSSKIYMFFTDTKEIYTIGPYFQEHATNGTMAWRKRYAMSRQYDETVAFAEERSFLEGYKNPLIQLDCMDVMLVISHSDNTFDKTQLRNKNSLTPDGKQLMKKTNLTLNHFIKDNDLRKFFSEV